MLTRSRVAASGALVLALAAGVGAPAASASIAASASHSASASAASRGSAAKAHFPPGAAALLSRELGQAWQITRGQGVTIAVLSTAVDPVTELAGKLIQGPDYAPLPGASAVDGTLLSTLIAGSGPTGTNPFGTIGRAPGAKILAERVADYGDRGGAKYLAEGTWQAIMARAIRYAVDHGAGVIVIFAAGDQETPGLDAAVQYAVSRKVIVLGSALALTNAKPSPPAYPDSLPGVINFTGVTLSGPPGLQGPDMEPANSSVLVAVPDNSLAGSGPGDTPYTAWGFYSDIAWAAGTVALMKAVYPQITPAQAARALAESASYRPPGGYNARVGFGLINPIGALHDAGALVKLGTSAQPGSGAVSPTSLFGKAQPATINAVKHPTAKLAGPGAGIVVGLGLVLLAVVLAFRRRRRQPAGGPVAGGLVSSLPGGASPPGGLPTAASPPGPFPTGASEQGALPPTVSPPGLFPTGASEQGALPPTASPPGPFPTGASPTGTLPPP